MELDISKLILALAALTLLFSPASSTKAELGAACTIVEGGPGGPGAQCCKVCSRGKACGNSCIAANKTCRRAGGCACNAGAAPRIDARLREAQREPNVLGYETGTPDGLAESRTRAALIGFQRDENLPTTGELDVRTQRALLTARERRTAAAATPVARSITTRDCTVASVTDGDTLVCGGGERIRLLLIDTPEMDQAPYGLAAQNALVEMAPVGALVQLEMDVEGEDRYGRTLAYVWRNGKLLNEEMAAAGYALSLTYPPNVKHVERIRAAVEQARAFRRGLWSGSAFECSPKDHRARQCD